jgi:hypothetical protein
MHRIALVVGLAAVTLGVWSAPAVADDTFCVLSLTGQFDNVVVPENTACTLVGSRVKGNVKVLRGASLFSSDNTIGGNVEGDGPAFVGSAGDTIGGNFTVTGATGPGFEFQEFSLNVFVCGALLPEGNITVKESVNGTIAVGSTIDACPGNVVAKGNIKVEDNLITAPPEALAVQRNTVGGNIQVFKNRGEGEKFVTENTVRQNLQCKENDQPFAGSPNVARNAEGQCTAAAPAGPRTLTGETLSQHTFFTGATTGNCSTDSDGRTSYSFDFAGFAAGPYPGTFTEHVDVTIGPATGVLPIGPFPGGFFPPGPNPSQFLAAGQLLSLQATFTINSPNGDVSGSKTLSAVVPANATHSGVCADLSGAPGPFGPVSGAYTDFRAFDLVYEATITTAEGSFTDEGTSQAQGRQGRIVDNQGGVVSDVNDFGETFQSTLTEPAPAGG